MTSDAHHSRFALHKTAHFHTSTVDQAKWQGRRSGKTRFAPKEVKQETGNAFPQLYKPSGPRHQCDPLGPPDIEPLSHGAARRSRRGADFASSPSSLGPLKNEIIDQFSDAARTQTNPNGGGGPGTETARVSQSGWHGAQKPNEDDGGEMAHSLTRLPFRAFTSTPLRPLDTDVTRLCACTLAGRQGPRDSESRHVRIAHTSEERIPQCC